MAVAPPDGQEKVIAAAQQIVKSLANSKNRAPQCHGRLRAPGGGKEEGEYGREWGTPGPGFGGDGDDLEDERDAVVEDALRLVEQWDSTTAGDRLVFKSPEDAEEYLAVAACLMGEAGPRVEAVLTASLTAEDLHASLLRRLSLTVPTFHSASSVNLDCPSFAESITRE
uniref:Uncharacterized protein n=1 Tax=Triticum aestivum TaxID=4565 RepID=A0A077RY32_WHEAT|nr:unnamed protein product [Triticum aestivum]